MHRPAVALALLWLGVLLISGCTPAAEVAAQPDVPRSATAATASRADAEPSQVPPALSPSPTPQAAPATPTTIPTTTPTLTPTSTPSPTSTLTPTPIGPCTARVPTDDDLLVLVSQIYGISRAYEPADLVPLRDYFDADITLGYAGEVRALIVPALQTLIADMQAVGLQPQILSGYRSYSAQAVAYSKWLRDQPERVGILSARPGHSEHQLGTTIDFGSPELAEIIGDPDIEFHTNFYLTDEGAWLANNAHRYGFTLSFSRDSFDESGFYFEPWHFRYVGVEMATLLDELELTLTQYLLQNEPPPCIPAS